jgi:23S rRNA pseudouridine2604 synthase
MHFILVFGIKKNNDKLLGIKKLGESLIRLSKLMSERGICSRREADRYIESGLVSVNGEVVSTLGLKVSEDVQVELLPEAKKEKSEKVTILLNKPLGYVSNLPEPGYTPAVALIVAERQFRSKRALKKSYMDKLAVAGRLDIDSKGLLVFTQDGVLVKQLIGEGSEVEKEYLVRVEGEITTQKLNLLSFGLQLDGVHLKRADVEVIEPQLLKMVLREGKKRQIRRMCAMLGLTVQKLKRVRIGSITLGNLPEGCWRFL